MRNLHQCLIAEIAFDPVVIPIGKDPSNWDKLAQRNIAWSDIGSAQAVTTFEIKPTSTALSSVHTPDELMIDWQDIPNGSLAMIFLSAVNVFDIIEMADKMYTSHQLIRIDDHTLQCKTRGITYIPIPSGGNINYAGLLSVDFPEGLQKERVFNVIVRQVTNAFGKKDPPPPPKIKGNVLSTNASVGTEPQSIKWRRVIGAFQLGIPVKTKEDLLLTEERQLSVLKWIAEAIPTNNRWYPVFNRYIQRIGGRVSSFGGNPKLIGPSPVGDLHKKKQPGGEVKDLVEFTGKISGLIFD
jgi:hypothetical protein